MVAAALRTIFDSLTSNGLTTTYRYNGLGDKLSYQRSDGNNRQYTLDLNGELSQILQDGYTSYIYGLNRLGYELWDEHYQYETDALGSERQLMRTSPGGSPTWVNTAVVSLGSYLKYS